MSNMCKLKDEYYDNLFSSANAMGYYAPIINKLRDIIDIIDEGKEKSKAFECTPDITMKLKQIGNYFVDKYNEELEIDNNVKWILYKVTSWNYYELGSEKYQSFWIKCRSFSS